MSKRSGSALRLLWVLSSSLLLCAAPVRAAEPSPGTETPAPPPAAAAAPPSSASPAQMGEAKPESEAQDSSVDESELPEDNTIMVRMRLWTGEGFTFGSSKYTPATGGSDISTGYGGNRFVLGYDLNFGTELRWIVGISFEVLSSGESTAEVGPIHRRNSVFSGGYFLIPHVLYAKLSAGAEAVTADLVQESNGANFAFVAGLTLGMRLPLTQRFNAGVEANFESIQSVSATQLLRATSGAAKLPGEMLFSLGLVLGFDIGQLR